MHHFLGSAKAAALLEFYSITGADVTGHFNGKGRPTRFNIVKKIGDDVIGALAGLDLGVYPSQTLLNGCENFFCQLFNTHVVTAMRLRWHMFKQLKGNQGIYN